MTIPEYYNTHFTPYHEKTFLLWQDPDIRLLCRRKGPRIIDFSRSSSVLRTGEAWLRYMLKRKAAQ